ncbi:MAG: 50S ribosomal protein L18e [Candidatus Nezhaarchaeota archaeon]|nr:50S ribosomal protein L18e [Candidatus Nezhaarchaeota archaeon]
MREVRATSIVTRRALTLLRRAYRQQHARLWRDLAERINRPKRKKISVNLSRINRYAGRGEVVVVPGKVLGAGTIDHPVTVAALAFSRAAKEKIIKVGGRALTIEELVAENPSGTNIKIIG